MDVARFLPSAHVPKNDCLCFDRRSVRETHVRAAYFVNVITVGLHVAADTAKRNRQALPRQRLAPTHEAPGFRVDPIRVIQAPRYSEA